MSNYAYIDEQEINDLCDRIELRIWADGGSMSIDTIQQELRDGLPSDAKAYEDSIKALEAIRARRLLIEGAYPFCVENGVASFDEKLGAPYVYIFCTAIATLDPVHITMDARTIIFEEVAMNAAAKYFEAPLCFATGATSYRRKFGTYEGLLKKVARAVRELGDPTVLSPRGGGDAGLDFLVVKPFLDGDYPRIVVCGNCATGKTNWMTKGSETSWQHWFRNFFNRTPVGPLIIAFAVPFVADSDQRSRKVDDRTILFDRFRVAEYGHYAAEDLNNYLDSIRVVASELPLR